MQWTIKRDKHVVICKVLGELDHHNAKGMRDNIDIEIQKTDTNKLIFDFSALEFMDSSGIGVLMGRYKLINQLGGTVFVSGARAHIKMVITLSGLDKIVHMVSDIKSALNK